MTTYVALLRAVNVSGQKLIKMELLREIFEKMEFKNVRTYIQSGNVIFESKESREEIVQQKIEKGLYKALGYEVTTLVRTISDLKNLVKNNPFSKAKLSASLMLYVNFMDQKPDKKLSEAFIGFSNDFEKFAVLDREVFALCRKDVTEKLLYANTFVEKKLKVKATGRNWNTVNKLIEFERTAEKSSAPDKKAKLKSS